MTSIANVSELINRSSGGNSGTPENVPFWKDCTAMSLLGSIPHSLWTAPGSPGPGVAPSSAAIPTNATAGALRHTDATGGRQRWLRALQASAWSAGVLLFYDRLLHCGGFSGTSTSAQTVGTDITRYTGQSSIGNIILAEVYTQIGVTAVNVSCNYLDKDGTSRASGSVLFGGGSGRSAGASVQIPYNTADGANSVTRVVDATLAVSTGTAGSWGITIARPLFRVSVGGVDTSGIGTGTARLALDDVELLAGCCLGVLFIPAIAAQGYVRGMYQTVER